MFPGGFRLSDIAFVAKLTAAALALVASSPSVDTFAENRGSSPTTVTSASVTVTASGGSGARTYSWERISGDTSISVNSASSETTSFNWSGTPTIIGVEASAMFRCTVTDSTGSATADVNVSFSVYSGLAP